MNKQQRIRAFWKEHAPEILATPADRWLNSELWADEPAIEMTPIERAFWHDAHYTGLVLYPQWPIGPYFADFANPVAKVVIECDGRQWHADKQKDAERDAFMRNEGWTVYRFTGKQCFEMPRQVVDENGYEREEESDLVQQLRQISYDHEINCRPRSTYVQGGALL